MRSYRLKLTIAIAGLCIVFACNFDEGSTVMTEIFFPNAPFGTLSVHTVSKNFILDLLEVNELKKN